MNWLENKYINLLSYNLKYYTKISTNPFVANFRCPICKDSKKKEFLKRGYLYEKNNKIFFFCHNCNTSEPFWLFFSKQNPILYKDFKFEQFKNSEIKKPIIDFSINNRIITYNNIYLGKTINELPETDIVKQYVIKRQIPKQFWKSLFSSNIYNIIKLIPKYEYLYDKFKDNNIPFLIIPFFDKEKHFSYINCRSILPDNNFRYITLEINKENPKIWGIEYIDYNKLIYILEGPIDAMFLPNSLALSGIHNILPENLNTNKKNICFIYDNDMFHNKHIYTQITKRINEGYLVVIYDKNFQYKDLNDSIINNSFTLEQLYLYIQKRTFFGLNALLELSHISKQKNY